jgi:hypothetical protein
MMKIELIRHAYLPTCTLGRLEVGRLQLATIERPWIRNPDGPGGKPRVSCVPDGEYRLIQHSSERFPNVWALINPALGVWYQPHDVPRNQGWGRSAVLIHAGNRVRDVIGCIAVGSRHGVIEGEPAVISSQIALGDLRGTLKVGEHQLVVRTTIGARDEERAAA